MNEAARLRLALSRWIEALDHRGASRFTDDRGEDLADDSTVTPAGSPADRRARAVKLLNHFIFCRTLEDLGCLERQLLPRSPEAVHLPADIYSFDFADPGFDVLGHVHERYLASGRHDRGIFYTRREVVDAIVQRTVGAQAGAVVEAALALARAGDLRASRAKIERDLLHLRVLDPACGAGGFLVSAATELARAYRTWERQLGAAQVEGADAIPGWALKLLTGCIHGIDQDARAIEVARLNLGLWLVKTRPGAYRWTTLGQLESDQVLQPLPGNLLVANSLLDHRGAAAPGRFDVILGNPPYIGEEDHKDLFRPVAESPWLGRYYEGKMDYACFFVHLGIDLARPGGLVSFILPSYLTSAEGARKLNRRLAEEVRIEEVFDFGAFPVFAQTAPGQNNFILVLRKIADPDWHPRVARLLRAPQHEAEVWAALAGAQDPALVARFAAPQQRELRDGRGALRLAPVAADAICERMSRGAGPLSASFLVDTGIQAGPPAVSRKALERIVRERRGRPGEVSPLEVDELCQQLGIRIGEGVFVLSVAESLALELTQAERALLRPFYQTRQIKPYDADPTIEQEILYLCSSTCPDIAPYRRLRRHLDRFQPLLLGRRETASGRKPYFHLHWPRAERVFLDPKLVGVRQTRLPSFAYAEGPYFVDLAANVIRARSAQTGPLWALLAVLNSAPAYFWFYHRGKRKGDLLQIDGMNLETFPLPPWSDSDIGHLGDAAQRVSALRALLRGPGAGPAHLEREIGEQLDLVDRQVAALYGLADVALEELRRPACVY